ncbi:hypothetical protein Gorai_007577 [Gossypium raimondii]|uniref:Uncharacterized protein n=1 Tax=Gossypium raimondii TaxID=29730 RepID=A0A7J8Q946_GOSRA|nr:hypothetical protein [Gossypium raimondii]
MSTETKANLVKMKPSGQDGSSKGKFDAAMNKRKLESSSKQPVGAKQKSATTKAEVHAAVPTASWRFLSVGKEAFDIIVKSKTSSSSSKTSTSSSKTSTTTKAKVREKKVYTLPGQKHDPPEEEPLRIFYESLSKQIPKSEMAEFWMMEHGLLSPEKDRKAYEKKQRRQKQLRTGTPIKSWKPSGKPESSQKQQLASRNGDVKAKKRINNDIDDDDDDDDDDDFILSPKRRKG